MKILKIEYTDLKGAKRIINKKECNYTYKDMTEQLNIIYLNCRGEIKAYLKNEEVKIYNK